jgi:hypothetical protein
MNHRFLALTIIALGVILSACTTTTTPNLPTPQVIPLAEVDQARNLWDSANFTSYMVAVEETNAEGSIRVRVVVKDGEIETAILEDRLANGSYDNPRPLDPSTAAKFTVDALFERLEQDVLSMGPSPVNLDVVFNPTFGYPAIVEAEPVATLNEDGRLSLNREFAYSYSVDVYELLEEIFGIAKEPILELRRSGGDQAYCDTLRVYADRTSIYSDECNQLLLQIDPPLGQFADLEAIRAGFASLSADQELTGDGSVFLNVTGSGSGEAAASDQDAIWKLAEEMMALLSKPVGDGLTMIYSLGNNVVGVDMIGFSSQRASLTIEGNLHGALTSSQSEIILYADDGGVYTLSLSAGSSPEVLLNPPDSGYYQLRNMNNEVVVISNIFEDGSTTLGWSFVDRRRFREVALPSGSDTYGCDTGVDLSPVANLLVISGSSTSAECNRVPGLTVIDLEEGAVARILTEATAFNPVWSPDGTQIAFVQVEGEAANAYVVNPDGSGLTALTNFTAGGVNSVAWGQENTLFYGRDNSEDPDDNGIFMLEIDTDKITQVVFGSGVFVRSIAPDGDHMAFYEADGDFKIMVVPFNEVVPILQGVGQFVNFGGWISDPTTP